MKQLPNFVQFDQFEPTPSRKLFTAASDDTLSLLDNMLSFDPNKRFKAHECLQHTYFKILPRPTRPNKLPKVNQQQEEKKRKMEEEDNFGSNVKRRLFQ